MEERTPHWTPAWRLLFCCGAVLVLTILLGLACGSVGIDYPDWLAMLRGEASPLVQALVWDLRGPRVLLATETGAALALSGWLLQVLLRNPLADPYLLGVSGGASVGGLLVLLLGISTVWVAPAATAGAAGTLAVVVLLAGGFAPERLLLIGVLIGSVCSAAVTLLFALAPADRLPGMLFWLLGDLGQPVSHLPLLLGLVTAILMLSILRRPLAVVAQGDALAWSVGVSVTPVRAAVWMLASLLTGSAVVSAGAIGFVGLVVPQLARRLAGSRLILQAPVSALLGAALLVLADTIARTVLAPRQLPVGAITALLGAPTVAVILWRRWHAAR